MWNMHVTNPGMPQGNGRREVLGSEQAPHNGSATDNVINDIMGSAQRTLTWETEGLLVDKQTLKSAFLRNLGSGFLQEKLQSSTSGQQGI